MFALYEYIWGHSIMLKRFGNYMSSYPSLLSISDWLLMQHEVDAGVLKKVVLADGAVVTVKGARSVSLCHPIELPLPFNRTSNNFASGLLTLAGGYVTLHSPKAALYSPFVLLD